MIIKAGSNKIIILRYVEQENMRLRTKTRIENKKYICKERIKEKRSEKEETRSPK